MRVRLLFYLLVLILPLAGCIKNTLSIMNPSRDLVNTPINITDTSSTQEDTGNNENKMYAGDYVTITVPSELPGFVTPLTQITISGRCLPGVTLSATAGAFSDNNCSDGNFTLKLVPLPKVENTITITARDPRGYSESDSITITRAAYPYVAITSDPPANSPTSTLTLSGTCTTDVTNLDSWQGVFTDRDCSDGTWSLYVILKEGLNEIRVTGYNGSGFHSSDTVNITYSVDFSITNIDGTDVPYDEIPVTINGSVSVTGACSDNIAKLGTTGRIIDEDCSDGTWAVEVHLINGKNTVTVSGVDITGIVRKSGTTSIELNSNLFIQSNDGLDFFITQPKTAIEGTCSPGSIVSSSTGSFIAFQGYWNPTLGTLAPGTATGDYYFVDLGGTWNGSTWKTGDRIIWDGANWGKTVPASNLTKECPTGVWELDLILPEGETKVVITETISDVISATDAIVITVADVTAPLAPFITSVVDDVPPLTGNVANSAHTDDTILTINGTAEAKSTVTLYNGTYPIGRINADDTGNWTFTTVTLTIGRTYIFKANAKDASFNTSVFSATHTVIIDPPAPAEPSVTVLATKSITPTITGTATVATGEILTVTVNSVKYTAGDDNLTLTDTDWSLVIPEANSLTSGTYSVTATVTNSVGVAISDPTTDELSVDATAPNIPVITSVVDDVLPVTGNVVDNGYTDDPILIINGTAEANSIITLYNDTTSLGTATADGSGNWTFTTGTLATDHIYIFKATATDAVDNTSEFSATHTLTLNINPPGVPTVTFLVTNSLTPTITGTATVVIGERLTVAVNSVTYTAGDGKLTLTGTNWSLVIPVANALTSGFYSVTATISNGLGFATSDASSNELRVDTLAPTAPVITSVVDNVLPTIGNILDNGNTNDTVLVINGTAEANSSIIVYNGATYLGTSTTNGSGIWTFTTPTLVTNNTYIFKATARDAADNTSVFSTTHTVTVQTSPAVLSADLQISFPNNGVSYNTYSSPKSLWGTCATNVTGLSTTKGIFLDSNCSDGRWSIDYTTLDLGTNTFTITGVNGSGVLIYDSIVLTFLSPVPDPLAADSWHIINTGQNTFANNSGTAGFDMNIGGTYAPDGYFGSKVTVAVSDTGLQIAHPDLFDNVIYGSRNYITHTSYPYFGDPSPTNPDSAGDHGTSVAGVIAASKDNRIGSHGIAPKVSLMCFNWIADGAQSFENQINAATGEVDIINQSWGIDYSESDPGESTYVSYYHDTIRSGALGSLRAGGKSITYVTTAGNGFDNDVNSAWDPEKTIPWLIVVGAMNADGIKASYSQTGSNIWITAPGGEGGFPGNWTPDSVEGPGIITTDLVGCTEGFVGSNNTYEGEYPYPAQTNSFDRHVVGDIHALNPTCDYTSQFNGTSAAAPNASGAIALLIEAARAQGKELKTRDIKYLLARSAQQNPLSDSGNIWFENHAPVHYHFNNDYGFGTVDIDAAIALITGYTNLGTQSVTTYTKTISPAAAIPDNSDTGASQIYSVTGTGTVEEVQVILSVTHPRTGDLGVIVTSPNGTESTLWDFNSGFGSDANWVSFPLLSNAFYGESITGDWTIKIIDKTTGSTGTWTKLTLNIYKH